MHFHNMVMHWKCPLLNQDEQCELQEWIDKDAQERWDAIQNPWKALQVSAVEEMTAENQYVQKYVFFYSWLIKETYYFFSTINALPFAMQAALDEVERVTGMKAVLLMGGPIPAQDGNIGTHL